MKNFTVDQNAFTGLLFQDRIMKAVFAAYSEVLLVDASYKLNELFICSWQVIAMDKVKLLVCLLPFGNSRLYTKLVTLFKSHNFLSGI